jgi:hypothetical protein
MMMHVSHRLTFEFNTEQVSVGNVPHRVCEAGLVKLCVASAQRHFGLRRRWGRWQQGVRRVFLVACVVAVTSNHIG